MTTLLQQIATAAAENKKPSKQLAYEGVLHLIQKTEGQELELETRIALESLYAHFLPPVPAKPKTPRDVCAKFMANKDVRYYLNYINVDNKGRMQATDGHRLVRYKESSGMEEGYYDKALIKVDVDARYPEVDRVIHTDGILVTVKNKTIIDLPNVKGKHKHAYLIDLIDATGREYQIAINKYYFDTANVCLNERYDIRFKSASESLYMEDDEKQIILMPVRI